MNESCINFDYYFEYDPTEPREKRFRLPKFYYHVLLRVVRGISSTHLRSIVADLARNKK